MNILITGGAGFIGSNFVKWLLSKAPSQLRHLAVLDSMTYAGSTQKLGDTLSQIEFIRGDIRDSELVDSVVARFDLVIHFAAETHNDNSLKNPKLFFDTNVIGTLNLAMACVRADVRMHHVSTDEVFGDLPFDTDEEFDTASKYNPSSPYSASKASSDHIVRSWVRSFGLRATISNCSNNYGPNQHSEKLIPATIKALRMNRKPLIYGDGRNIRDWIHVDDHSSGVWAIISHGTLGETYLLGSSDQVRNVDLINMLIRAYAGDISEPEFVDDRPGHDRRYAINPSRAIQELGWKSTRPPIMTQGQYLLSLY